VINLLVFNYGCGQKFIRNDENPHKARIDSGEFASNSTAYISGQINFEKYCSYCHGPPGVGITEQSFENIINRLPPPAEEYFLRFINDSKKLTKSNGSYARALDGAYNGGYAHKFKDSLTTEEKRNLIIYLKVNSTRKHER
jgi:Cytochrome c